MTNEYTQPPSEIAGYERHDAKTYVPYEEYQKRQQETVNQKQVYQQKKAVWRSYNIIWFFVGIITALLAFRFIFELSGANLANTFVQLIYTLSYPFSGPFETIFGITSVARSIFDWSVLVAIIVYFLIGYALVQLLRIIRPVTPDEVNHRIHTI